jgi:hypothetical protein
VLDGRIGLVYKCYVCGLGAGVCWSWSKQSGGYRLVWVTGGGGGAVLQMLCVYAFWGEGHWSRAELEEAYSLVCKVRGGCVSLHILQWTAQPQQQQNQQQHTDICSMRALMWSAVNSTDSSSSSVRALMWSAVNSTDSHSSSMRALMWSAVDSTDSSSSSMRALMWSAVDSTDSSSSSISRCWQCVWLVGARFQGCILDCGPCWLHWPCTARLGTCMCSDVCNGSNVSLGLFYTLNIH